MANRPSLGRGALPNLPEAFKKHVFLKARDQGISASFTGRVLITVVFVSDPATDWTEAEMAQVKAGHRAMTRSLCAEAARWGAELELAVEYRRARVTCDLESTLHDAWYQDALESAGLGANASVKLETEQAVKEAPVLFYLNLTGRAFASFVIGKSHRTEFAVVYGDDADNGRCRHELFHLFGAIDFYYPDSVRTLARKYFPNSTMLTTGGTVTDPLTAYLIGWTDRLSPEAEAFLRETAWLTDAYLEQEHKKENYTGYVENWKMGDAVYTGYLADGVRQGLGTMTWPDGARYTGQWKEGRRSGTGKMYYANGAVYTGDFADGKLHGTGTYAWKNGDHYVGQWQNSKRHGQGTYFFADGSKKMGQWAENKFIG